MTALRQYVGTFFGGSLTRMIATLVNESSFTDEELGQLKADIERARKEKKTR